MLLALIVDDLFPFLIFLIVAVLILGVFKLLARGKSSGSPQLEPIEASMTEKAQPANALSANPPAVPRLSSPELSLHAALAILTVFAFLIIYRCVTEEIIPYYREQYVYVPVTADVVGTAIDYRRLSGKNAGWTYDAKVHLRYVVGERIHRGWCDLASAGPNEAAVADLRKYPLLSKVPAWYDPERPDRIVIVRRFPRLIIFKLGVPIGLIFAPIVYIWWKACKHFRLEQTTGRIIAVEIREKPAKDAASVTLYRPIFTVDYDFGTTAARALIEGGGYAYRCVAENDSLVLLAHWPLGTDIPVWYNPAAPDEVTFDFDHLTLTRAAVLSVLALVTPATAIQAIQFPGSMRRALKVRHVDH